MFDELNAGCHVTQALGILRIKFESSRFTIFIGLYR